MKKYTELNEVLQDVDNFYPNYINVIGDIPVASLEFLLEDFYKTYTTPDRALARISSDKFKKDIERFNIIKDLYQNGYGGSWLSNLFGSYNVKISLI